MKPTTHDYRPDIDGLRAVAVVLVILFHAVPGVVAGGFVGVDVFFVISGYLITSIILRETHAGTFTLQDFYARRCRRILPALIVVLAATWTVGRAALTSDDFRVVGKHIFGGATFTSNIVLWQETGYFDISAIRKPLLHLWSLGVEEQFYLVWPPLLMLAAVLRWRPLRLSVAVLAGSLAFAIVMTPARDALAFYMLPARMWELLAGAVLVQIEWRTATAADTRSRLGVAHELKAAAGLLLIAIPCFVDPGFGRSRIAWLVAPVAGTVLVTSAAWARINRRVLSHPVLVRVGLFSYPLYLWHWPLLSVVTLLSERATVFHIALLKAGAVSAAFLLAWLTWRFVELPVRRFAVAPAASRPRRNRQVLLASAFALSATSAVGWFSWDPARAAANVAAEAGEPLLRGDTVYPGAAYSRYSSASSVVLLVGDSHSAHLLPGLVPLARTHGFGVSHFGVGGCLGVPMAERLWGTIELFARCQSSAQAILTHFLPDPAVKIVLFSARGELYAEGREAGIVVAADNNTALPADVRQRVLHDAYADAIRQVEDAGKRAVLALDIPELDFVPEYCLSRLSSSSLFGKQCAIGRRSVDRAPAQLPERRATAQGRIPASGRLRSDPAAVRQHVVLHETKRPGDVQRRQPSRRGRKPDRREAAWRSLVCFGNRMKGSIATRRQCSSRQSSGGLCCPERGERDAARPLDLARLAGEHR